MTNVRPVRQGDLEHLAPRLRRADLAEIQASSGLPPLDALRRSVDLSEARFVAVDADDQPLALFGVASGGDIYGIVWMVGTDEVYRRRRDLIKLGRFFIDAFHAKYPVLTNLVDARNVTHQNWLRHLGANFVERVPEHGAEKRPFLRFIHV